MATPNIVPKADQEGGLGTAAKSWGKLFIENATAGGTAAATISNLDVDQIALDINANNTTANAVDITGNALTTANAINVTATGAGFRGAGLKIDQDHDSAVAYNGSTGMIYLDYDKATATGDGNTHNRTGNYITMHDAATNHANSTVTFIGSDAVLDAANTAGTSSGIAYQANVQDFKTNIGYKSTTEDVDVVGGINADFIAYSSSDAADYFRIQTGVSGATKIETVDGGAAAAHLTFAVDGSTKWIQSANTSDYLQLDIGTHGDAKFTTVDAAAAAAHFEVEADGNITLDAAGTIELEGNTNVTGDLGVSAEATVGSLICTAAGSFGGGYGSTGTTISTAGVGQFNGALTTDGALTADNIVCTNAATFGGGTGSTGATISTAGVGTFDGAISSTAAAVTGLNYRTLWIDAGAMVPQATNGAAAGTEEASTNDVMSDYFAFDSGTIEYVQTKLIMPDQWDGGVIKVKFYWKPASSTTTSHTCRWSIAGTAHGDGGTIDSSWGTDVAINDDVLGTAAGRVHVSDTTADVTIAGSPAALASELVYLRIQRVANHANDDLNEDAHLLGIAIQYREQANPLNAWA